MEQLRGTLERITYRSDDTGYTVAQLRPEGAKALVTIVGRLPTVQPGEILLLDGGWIDHRTHGRQFEVTRCETAPPASSDAIARYLSSGLLPGVGPVTAQRIVDAFGPETLTILDKEPRRLFEVKGLGLAKITAIVTAWEQQRAIKSLLELGQAIGLSTPLAIKIFKHYGEAAVEVVRTDPYRLALEIDGVGFPTADGLAQELGIAPDAPGRVTAGLRYALSLAARDEGHAALPAPQLAELAARTLSLPLDTVAAGLEDAADAALLIRDGELILLPPLYYAERDCAQALANLAAAPSPVAATFARYDASHVLAALEEAGFALSTQQRAAVMMALTTPVMILTGGPGTGKTTTIRSLLLLMLHEGFRVALAAPTGRAARRLAEATGSPAATIHRLLDYAGGADRWGRNESNPLDADVVIIDEASMLDILLAQRLLRAIRPGAHLLLVGDADQLPPVGPGAPLRDLLAFPPLARIHLGTIFRQAADSGIIANAHAINRGEEPDVNASSDFFWFPRRDPAQCAKMVVNLVTRRIPDRFPALDPRRDVQVLAPTHRGPAGVAALNALLQAALNPPASDKAEATVAGTLFRAGDRVIQLRNNYDLDVSNGDLGFLISLNADERTAEVHFDDGRAVTYAWSELDEVALAYAISVHKSQGAEYPAVVLPMLRYYGNLLYRALIYTAVTRARELVVLTGDWDAVGHAVATHRSVERITTLVAKLHALWPAQR